MRFRFFEVLSIVLILSAAFLSLNGDQCSAQEDVTIGDTITFDFEIDSTVTVNVGSIEITLLDDSLEIIGGSWSLGDALIAHFDKTTGKGVFLFSTEVYLDRGTIFTVECKVVSAGDCGIVADMVFKDDSGSSISIQKEAVFDNPVPDNPEGSAPSIPEGPGPSEPGSSGIIDPGTDEGGSTPSEVLPEDPSPDRDEVDVEEGPGDSGSGSEDDYSDGSDQNGMPIVPIIVCIIAIGVVAVILTHRIVR